MTELVPAAEFTSSRLTAYPRMQGSRHAPSAACPVERPDGVNDFTYEPAAGKSQGQMVGDRQVVVSVNG